MSTRAYHCQTCQVSTPPMTDAEAKVGFDSGHVLTFTVTDVWGRSREAKVYPLAYDDAGATAARSGFGCPFCSSVTLDRSDGRWPRCENPCCEAQAQPTDACALSYRAALLDKAHEAGLREVDDRFRADSHRWAMQRIREEREAKDREYAERRETAIARGACPRCATRDMYRPARFVRHRVACPAQKGA